MTWWEAGGQIEKTTHDNPLVKGMGRPRISVTWMPVFKFRFEMIC